MEKCSFNIQSQIAEAAQESPLAEYSEMAWATEQTLS